MSQAQENPMGRVIVKCWEDEAFKRQLIAEPEATLRAEGVDVPAGLTVKVVANSKNLRHIVIPERKEGEPEEEASRLPNTCTIKYVMCDVSVIWKY